ncbi:MAG: hypothetical protein FWE22_01110 [Firmicutes bacterium]|nr:hypothetical protein [Bacillota bacterium]
MRNIEEFSFEELVSEVKRLHLSLKDMQSNIVKSHEAMLKERQELASLLVKHNDALRMIEELKNALEKVFESGTSEVNEKEKLIKKNKKNKKEIEIDNERKFQEFNELKKKLQCEASRDDYLEKLKERADLLKRNNY